MKAPNLPSFSDSWPVPQVGQRRGSEPSALAGKMWSASISLSASSTSETRRSLISSVCVREVGPEVAQHVLPVELAGRDLVELLLEAGGEAVLDELGEEALEERRDDAAAILGDQRALFEPHVVAVLQHRACRRIGRGPADAELFHLLDEAGFGVARRRLGEMLLDQRFVELGRVADGERRQLAAILVVLVIVARRTSPRRHRARGSRGR